jgi:hypothetical protein
MEIECLLTEKKTGKFGRIAKDTKSLKSAETHLGFDPDLLKIVRSASGIFMFYIFYPGTFCLTPVDSCKPGYGYFRKL